MFNNDENFTANLNAIPATDWREERELEETLRNSMGNKTIDLGSLAPENLEKLRLRNKWRTVLQNNLQNITKDLLVGDTEKSYMADPREMMRVLEHRMRPTTEMQ